MRLSDVRLPGVATVFAMLLSGCVVPMTGAFSPVRGPLAKLTPVVDYTSQMTGALSGTITVSLPGDGTCTGPWSLRGPQQQSFDLAAAWDQIYGTGYHTAHVLGVRQFVRTTLNCSGGGAVRLELANENNSRGNTRGVAEDDQGNVFKVSVYN